jgi:alcohol dehydrogenase
MRQLFYEGPGRVAWRDIATPSLGADHEAIVAPIAATTCDVDAAVIAGISPFEPPFALGHEAVARVVDVGDGVQRVSPGDIVSVPYHRSCGTCSPCRSKAMLHCEQHGTIGVPAYGFPHAGEWGGMFGERFRVPHADHALVTVPDNIDPIAVVSAGDNLADAWSTTVPHLKQRPDADVLILSFGGYGLYASQWALAAGAASVTYVDDHPTRLSVASDLGALTLPWTPELRLDRRFDLIVNARPGDDSLRMALRAAAPNAVCESTAIFFDDVALPLASMHRSGVRFRSTYSTARLHLPDVIDALSRQQIDPRRVESEVVALDDVPERFADLTHKPIVLFEQP